MKVVIVYHSRLGHIRVVAEHIAKGVLSELSNVLLLPVNEVSNHKRELDEADTIVFGSPTYFGNVSGEFKNFMESTGEIWFNQRWKNKLAAAFTNSSTKSGDKLNTLISLSLFAAQHSMIWLPVGILPQYDEKGRQLEEPNGMGSYLGLMTFSDNSYKEFTPPGDLETAEKFGRRIGALTLQLRSTKSKNEIQEVLI